MPSSPRYRRVLLKLSGEGLMGSREYGLDPAMVSMVAQEIKTVHEMGVQVCLVIGGGNIFRGVSAAASGMDRASGDYMGMLATVINALAMQDLLERKGLVRHVPHRGARVVQLGVRDARDIYLVRQLIESAAIERAASRPLPPRSPS